MNYGVIFIKGVAILDQWLLGNFSIWVLSMNAGFRVSKVSFWLGEFLVLL